MEENLEIQEDMTDELEEDVQSDYAGDLEEYHQKVDSELEDIEGEKVDADCRNYRRLGSKYYIMYHGTTLATAKIIKAQGFKRSRDGMLGPGVYLSRNYKKACRYPLQNRSQRLAVVKVAVRVGKVKKITCKGHRLQKTWHKHGYDTAWVPPNCGMVPSGLEEDCVYDPSRITFLQIIEHNIR